MPQAPELPDPDTLYRFALFLGELLSYATTKQTFSSVLRWALEITGGQRGFIVISEAGRLTVKASLNFAGSVVPDHEQEVSRSFLRLALGKGEVMHTGNVELDLEALPNVTPMKLKARSIAVAPIKCGPRIVGALVVDHERLGGFSVARCKLLEPLAAHTGACLEKFSDQDLLPSTPPTGFPQFAGLIGRAPKFLEMLRTLDFVAPTNNPVLIRGETGTGKELIAIATHKHSSRKAQAFVTAHTAAFSPTLYAAELFGHVRGSYTGADGDRPGILQAAHEGTLFLDELGEMPMEVQTMLLRVLEYGDYKRVGSEKFEKVNVRIGRDRRASPPRARRGRPGVPATLPSS